MALWRFDSTGILDPTFGGRGYVTHHNAAGGRGHDVGNAIAIDPEGRIIVVGSSVGGSRDLAVWRFRPDGTLDGSFGPQGRGYAIHDNAAGGRHDDEGNAVALDPSGRILVAGYSSGVETFRIRRETAVWAFTPQGSLDTAFDGVGYRTVHFNEWEAGDDEASGLVVYPDTGRIILSVVSRRNFNQWKDKMWLWGLSAQGAVDKAFGSGGIVKYAGPGETGASSIQIDARSFLVVTGYRTDDQGNRAMAVWRFSPSGAIDANFGTRGEGLVVHYGFGSAEGKAIRLDGTDRILVTGFTGGSFALWTFNQDGSLDTSFGTDGPGFTTHDSAAGGTGADVGNALVVDEYSRIVAAGYSLNAVSNEDMVVWRFGHGRPRVLWPTQRAKPHAAPVQEEVTFP